MRTQILTEQQNTTRKVTGVADCCEAKQQNRQETQFHTTTPNQPQQPRPILLCF